MSIEERSCLFGLTILTVFKLLRILTAYLYVHIPTPGIKDVFMNHSLQVPVEPKVKVRPYRLQNIKNALWLTVEFGHRRISYPSVSHMYFRVDESYATLLKSTWNLFWQFTKHTEDKPFDAEKDELVWYNALASLANISAQNLVHHVSENYTNTLRNYIEIGLKEVFNLNASDINTFCQYVFNNSVNSSIGVTWLETLQNTPDNITLVYTIIGASRITNEPVAMTLIATNPGILLQHMYQMLLYFEAFNNDNIRTFNEVQKQVLSRNDLFKVLN
ncbi:hypothetical protein BDF21DRAFT_498393, partial [Thamnidium elegans]